MATETPASRKPISSLILDTGPLIKNTISISTLINAAEELYTTPAILSEVRDEATRSRVQTTLVPFLKIKTPSPASYEAVIAFSKKTGDYPVLSRQDLGILALAYEVHCEKNGGPLGLRDAPRPAVKRKAVEAKSQEKEEEEPQEIKLNEAEPAQAPVDDDDWEQPSGKRATKRKVAKPIKFKYEVPDEDTTKDVVTSQEQDHAILAETLEEQEGEGGVTVTAEQIIEQEALQQPEATETTQEEPNVSTAQGTSVEQAQLDLAPEEVPESTPVLNEVAQANLEQDVADLTISQEPTPPATDSSASEDDSDGDWITPSNLEAQQAKDADHLSSSKTSQPNQITTATMTTDFAMQNVLLQMNLILLSPSLSRIKHVTTKVFRCQACFSITKDMSKQFCPRCGQSTLAKVSCSTNSRGEFKIHLARNYTYNKRGDKYSIPKPIAGTANGKWSGQGGGKGGWGRDLILTEDQKEYTTVLEKEKRGKTKDLMDEDYLPGILTGNRGKAGGRVKVGAGKNVNAKKRV